MRRRMKYEVGDIFTIKIDEENTGIGRILIKDEDTIFIELYDILFNKDIEYSRNKEITRAKVIAYEWCYNDGLKKKKWQIVDNIPVTEEIDMPYFWTEDSANGKYYLIEGTHEWSGKMTGIEISKEDISKYSAYGIGNMYSVPKAYKRKLIESGIIHEVD